MLVSAKKYVEENPIASISVVTGTIGGLTLFWYCLLIGRIPDFALSEVLGIFLVSFLTGSLIIFAFALSCLAPAACALYILEVNLPEKSDIYHYWRSDENKAESAHTVLKQMRGQLLTGAFPCELSALAVIAWSALWLSPLAEFAWPSNPALLRVLYGVALACLLLLVCAGGTLSHTPKIALRVLATFCSGVAVVLYVFHRTGYPSPVDPLQAVKPTLQSPKLIWAPTWSALAGLPAYTLAFATAAVLTGALTWLALHGNRRRQIEAIAGPRRPRPRPSMLGARVSVALAYVGSSFLPLMAALNLASANGPAHSVRSLAMTILYLALFNYVFFCIASIKRNLGKSSLLALAFLAAILLVPVQKPTIIPKTVVYTLGFGNFHSSVVVLPAKECARLLVYGVECDAKKDGAIALTNVNIISKMGANPVLELMVRREGRFIDAALKADGLDPDADLAMTPRLPDVPSERSLSAAPGIGIRTRLHAALSDDDFTFRNNAWHYVQARQCDDDAASWLRVSTVKPIGRIEHDRYIRLRCVTITIQKNDLLDYDKEGWRSYQSGYSEFAGSRSLLSSAEK